MDSNIRNDQNDFQLSPKKRKDDKCAKCGRTNARDQVKDVEDLIKKSVEIHLLRKHLDFFEAKLNAMKKLNGDIQVSKREVSKHLSIMDDLKGLRFDMDESAGSGLPATDSSALYQKLCELIEKFSHLNNMVSRIDSIFSRKTVRNLTNLLDDWQKNMLGFQVGLKEFQYIGAMERQMIKLNSLNKELFQLNASLDDGNNRLFDIIERQIQFHEKYLIKRRRYSR